LARFYNFCCAILVALLLMPCFADAANAESRLRVRRERASGAIAALGAELFSDFRLSKDGTLSCASCHDPKLAFTNPRPPTRAGVKDERLRRDVPSLLGVRDVPLLHHDGREPSLELQILAPLFNPAEMANTTFGDLTARLNAIEGYRRTFDNVFGGPATIDNLGAAIAAYERTLEPGRCSICELIETTGGTQGMSRERDGLALFRGKAGCASCHVIDGHELSASRFTKHEFINTGIGFQSEARRAAETPEATTDRGREEVTHQRDDRYKFRVPTLRNVELTAPYMHDGSVMTLEAVVAYYNAGGSSDPEKDARIKPLGLTEAEERQLVAFLDSLTSPEARAACGPANPAKTCRTRGRR